MQLTFSAVLRRRLGYGLVAALIYGGGAVSMQLWNGVRHVYDDHVRHHDVVDTLGPGTLAQMVAALNALLTVTPEAVAVLQQQAAAVASEPTASPEEAAEEEPTSNGDSP